MLDTSVPRWYQSVLRWITKHQNSTMTNIMPTDRTGTRPACTHTVTGSSDHTPLHLIPIPVAIPQHQCSHQDDIRTPTARALRPHPILSNYSSNPRIMSDDHASLHYRNTIHHECSQASVEQPNTQMYQNSQNTDA